MSPRHPRVVSPIDQSLTIFQSESMACRREDHQFLVHFIKAVKARECLWNSLLPTYNKSEEIIAAWKDIAAEINDTEKSCRERWKNIRTSFVRSLKPLKPGSDQMPKKYYLAHYLSFLLPFVKRGEIASVPLEDTTTRVEEINFSYVGNIELITPKKEVEEEVNEASPFEESPGPSTPMNYPTDRITTIAAAPTTTKAAVATTTKAAAGTTTKAAAATTTTAAATTTTAADEAIIAWVNMKKNKAVEYADADKMFFYSLLPDIGKLSASRKRKYKMQTLSILTNLLEEEEQEALGSSSQSMMEL